MVKYAKCPRCELNYIDVEKQQYCDVCIKEMKGLDEEPFYSEEEDDLMELCPQCGENMLRSGETMCEQCKKKMQYEEEEDVDVDMESDEEWRNYLDDEAEESDDLGLDEEFGAEFADDEEEEDEEYHDEEEEDFEYVTGDDIYKYVDDEDDDDDEDDEDDEEENGKSRRKSSDDDDF